MANLYEGIGKLGFGLMRLPMIDKKIDVEQTKVMVDKFMDAGFNYFDTARAYGESAQYSRDNHGAREGRNAGKPARGGKGNIQRRRARHVVRVVGRSVRG